MDKQRHLWADAGRGLAILLVVFYHAAQAFPPDELAPVYYLNEALAYVRMPLFFFLAGLFAAKWSRRPWGELLRSKVAVLYWLYLVWLVISLAVTWVITASTRGEVDLGAELAYAIRSLIFPHGTLWFIWLLPLFLIALRATANLPAWVPLVPAVVGSLAMHLAPEHVEAALIGYTGYAYRGALLYLVFFLAGARLSGMAFAWVLD